MTAPVDSGGGRRLFLADVDHTLVRRNTTFAFVAHVVRRRGRIGRRLIHATMLGRRSPGRLLAAAWYRLAGRDPLRALALGMLRGLEREAIESLAREYVEAVLERELIPEPMVLLRKAEREGARVCLVSASLDVVVEPLAAALGVECRASALAWEGGCATGRLAGDLAGAKLAAVEDLLAGADHVTVMSDNLSDLPLFRRADRRLVVLRRPGDQVRWTGLLAEFLGPYSDHRDGGGRGRVRDGGRVGSRDVDANPGEGS